MKNKRNRNILFLLVITAIFGCGQVAVCSAQEQSKSILSEEYINKKRKITPIKKPSQNPKQINAASGGKAKKRTYRVVRPLRKPRKPTPINEEAMLGLTVWKARPATENDEAKGLIEEESGGKITLERRESETPLEIGDRIRLTVETLSRKGYLYVIDRELYSDGTYSSPKLIYPTQKTIRRNIAISPGNLIFIPETRNFVVEPVPGGKNQIAEVLTVIISPKILIEDSMLKQKAIDLPPAQFADWLKWEVETALIEQNEGAGQAITPIELSAASGESAKGLVEELKQDDPPAQSVYRALIKRGNPFLVNVFLKFQSK